MTTITLTTFLSLDGVVQGPGGADEDREGGFDRGGWLVPHTDEDMGKIVAEQFAKADGFLLGRRTYDIFTTYWPHVTDPDDPVASKLNGLPKYVASRTLTQPGWAHTTVLNADVVAQVAELKRQPGREIQIHGSGTLARTLMAHRLIDEFSLWFYPVVVGAGKRLFPAEGPPAGLRLVDTRVTGAGVAVHTYRLAGDAQFGDLPPVQ